MELYHKISGQGPALIVLHGLFGSSDNWASHARVWSSDFSVYLVDQRNHGRSPHAPTLTYADMAHDLADFMDQQGITRAYLLGHSMGGKTVMQMAAWDPERVEKMIVADMAPKAYPPHHQAVLHALREMDLSRVQTRQEAESMMARLLDDPVQGQFLLKSLTRDEQQLFRWRFNLPVILRDYEAILADIETLYPVETPTLFLYGGRSNYLRPEDKTSILARFPQATFDVIPEAGHWLHADNPPVFLQKVRDYLLS
ncbi:MAG: alpha/beta fold hydrolase [Bacteroidia bacterium]|nr:alpha/beta fold hydrolase [Bacteroidia bacterium]